MKNKKAIIAVVTVIVGVALIIGLWQIFGRDYTDNSGTLSITRSEFTPRNDIINKYTADPSLMTGKIAASFGMDIVAENSFHNSPEEWLAYDMVLSAVNNSNVPVTLHSLNVPNNGQRDVYICTELESGIGLSVGGNAAISVTVLCGNGDLGDAEVEAIAREMNIAVNYSVGSLDVDRQTLTDTEKMTVYIDA